MATRTVRAHVEKALRTALRLNSADAKAMCSTSFNECNIDAIRIDMRDCFATVNDLRDVEINLFLNDLNPIFRVAYLRAGAYDLRRWEKLTFEEAYALPDRVSKALSEQAKARIAADEADARPEDEDDLRDVPMARAFAWKDGIILSAKVVGEHVEVEADIDGSVDVYGMTPLFGTPGELGAYAKSRIGQQARLCVEPNHPDHALHGVPDDIHLISMIIPQNDVPALTRSLRKAA